MSALLQLDPADAYYAGQFAVRLERARRPDPTPLSVRCPDGRCMLALHLALRLRERAVPIDRVAVCSGCGRTYVRAYLRGPKGKKNWCPRCRERTKGRMTVAAWRARKGESS